MALRATVRRLGDLKPGVQPHLEIWWKKKPKVGVTDGMVQRTISPFELQPIKSLWTQYAPGNFLNNFASLWDVGPGVVVLVGTVTWADWYFDVLGREHRD